MLLLNTALTSAQRTTEEEWEKVRLNPSSMAPWADFETDYFLLQVPSSWIKDFGFEHMKAVIEGHNKALKETSNIFGVPPEMRNKHILYVQVDVDIKYSVFGVGYPQINQATTSGPDGPLANKGHFFVSKPFLQWDVLWHEWGHCNVVGVFGGEREATVNFPYAYVRNVLIGENLDLAFSKSRTKSGVWTIDNTAKDWMVRSYFREGKEMSVLGYVHKGYGKYADIVRLFGWDVIRTYFHKVHLDVYERDYAVHEIHPDFDDAHPDMFEEEIDELTIDGLTSTESKIINWSIEAGADLSPLIREYNTFSCVIKSF